MPGLFDFYFKDLLPGSIAGDQTIQAAAQVLDNELKRVARGLDKVLIYHRLDELAGDILNLLAWQYSVDFFDIDMPDEQKRNAIRGSSPGIKRRGRPGR